MERMTTHCIDGRALARAIRASVAAEITELELRPGLGVILVGDDPASRLYVALKEKACAEVGIQYTQRLFPTDTPQEDIIAAVKALNTDPEIDAILVQLPLPSHMDADDVVAAMDPKKDVDGFHPENLFAYLEGSGEAPGLVEVISMLLDEAKAPAHGLAAVLANSAVFSAPVETMLSRRGLEPTEDAAAADVVVTALGKPGSLAAEQIKPGAIVIDVGTTRVDAHTVGDADATSLNGVAGALTPVPGGVGPMTVAMLLKKALELAKRRRNIS